jgi:hypothetical protein
MLARLIGRVTLQRLTPSNCKGCELANDGYLSTADRQLTALWNGGMAVDGRLLADDNELVKVSILAG